MDQKIEALCCWAIGLAIVVVLVTVVARPVIAKFDRLNVTLAHIAGGTTPR